MLWFYLGLSAAIASLVIAILLVFYIGRKEPGTDKMRWIASIIKRSSRAYLLVQDKYLGIFVAVMAIIIGFFFGIITAVSYVIGSFFSMVAGIIGMEVAVRANVRTTAAAYKKDEKEAFQIAYLGGSVMGLMVISTAILGITLLYALTNSFTSLLGFSLGASSVALFAKAGGGIYTKTADIAADLVGKVELELPEDDPRNPAVIADNVGDIVGDVAGTASDLYDSYVASIVATMIIGFERMLSGHLGEDYISLPIIIAAIGIFSTLLGLGLSVIMRSRDPSFVLNTITLVVVFLYIVLLWVILSALNVNLAVFISTSAGLLAGALMGISSDYFTEIDKPPVKKIAEASTVGGAINILMGFSYGTLSIIPSVIGVVAATMVAWYSSVYYGLYPIYGIAIAAIGMLGIVGTIVSADAYGPIADNAKGIAEQAKLDSSGVISILDRLDAAGNTTKAITKGFAIGAAALTVLALFAAFSEITDLEILLDSSEPVVVIPTHVLNLVNPNVVSGALIGAMIPPVISALLILSVSKNTEVMIEEIRRQVKEKPGILTGEEEPDYERCVSIASLGALKELMLPGLIAVISPIIVGIILGLRALAAFLFGSILTGFIYAIFMANSGGAWDNAKKYIEEGNYGGKGSFAHKAAVVGDTVGDPFKDTAGPTLNTMITVMSLIASTFAPLIAILALFP